jgi:hypothetical protein
MYILAVKECIASASKIDDQMNNICQILSRMTFSPTNEMNQLRTQLDQHKSELINIEPQLDHHQSLACLYDNMITNFENNMKAGYYNNRALEETQLNQSNNLCQMNQLKSWKNRFIWLCADIESCVIKLELQETQLKQQADQMISIQPDLLQLSDLYHEQQSKSTQLEAELQRKDSQLLEQEDNIKQLLATLEISQSEQGLASAISSYFK